MPGLPHACPLAAWHVTSVCWLCLLTHGFQLVLNVFNALRGICAHLH